MGGIGCGFAVIAVLLAIVTALPLLGWANWLLTIPAALLAIIFSGIGLSRGQQTTFATIGLIVGTLTLFWALFRLSLGGGFI